MATNPQFNPKRHTLYLSVDQRLMLDGYRNQDPRCNEFHARSVNTLLMKSLIEPDPTGAIVHYRLTELGNQELDTYLKDYGSDLYKR